MDFPDPDPEIFRWFILYFEIDLITMYCRPNTFPGADYQPNIDLMPGADYFSAPPVLCMNEEAALQEVPPPVPESEDLLPSEDSSPGDGPPGENPSHEGEELLSEEERTLDTRTR